MSRWPSIDRATNSWWRPVLSASVNAALVQLGSDETARAMDRLWKACVDGPARPEIILVDAWFARLMNRHRTGIWPRRIRHRNPRRVKLSWLSR